MNAFFAVFIVAMYFLPTIWAYTHHARERASAVLLVNLLFGWTVIGWLVALFMANGKACSGVSEWPVQE